MISHGPTRWREAWIGWRNRRLADPGFQRWAAEFPLTRPIARKRTQALFDLVAGFVYSQTLCALVELEVLGLLAVEPITAARLAEARNLPIDASERLLGAARALGLADEVGVGRFALGPHGAVLMGNPGLVQMIAHHHHLYSDLADSVGLMRRGRGSLADYWPYAKSASPRGTTGDGVAAYSALMAATQPTVAADILHAYPVSRHRRLLDVGGGEGAFLTAAGTKAPRLDLMLFDLPAVAHRARGRLLETHLLDRTEILEGDFLSDPIPTGADLITLIRILHDHDDNGVQVLLRAIRAALPTDGTLLIAEPMSAGKTHDRVADVYFAFYLLAMGRGRARSTTEIFDHLRAAGFSRMRSLRTRTPSLLRAILAQP